jgi:hypothetical protein
MSAPNEGLPRHTTPTWEVELLISGVAVFAMLQLAGWLNDLLFMLLPRFGEAMRDPLRIMYVYTESAAVILSITFIAHLVLRARWIALVGMHSVFPEGIRWDRLRSGPAQKALDMQRLASPDALIERADNMATVVFAIGVQLASTLLLVSVLVGILFTVAMMVASWCGLHPDPGQVFMWCVLGLLLPFGLFPVIDRHIGARLRTDGLAYRLLTWVFRGLAAIGLSQNASVIALASSHGGRRRVGITIALLMLMVSFGVLSWSIGQAQPERFGAYALFPDADDIPTRAFDNAHYDGRRDPSRDATAPYVRDPVATGPYLQLAVPFVPGRDDLALRAACPGAPAMSDSEHRSSALLDCLQRLYSVRIDGKPLRALRYDAGTDPRGDRPLLVAMIDIRALAPGRHELAVVHPVDPADKDADDGWDRIAFWR